MNRLIKGIQQGLLVLAPLVAFPVHAAVVSDSWDFDSSSAGTGWGGYSSSVGYQFTSSDSTNTVNISGYAEFNNGLRDASACLRHWDGIGLDRESSGCPNNVDSNNDNHRIDNGGPDEFVVLKFNTGAFELQSVQFASRGSDSDFTVLRYTGAGVPAPLVGNSVSSLTAAAAGWEVIGHYGNNSNTKDISSQTAGKSSSYWAIGAYMSSVSNPGSTYTSGSLGSGNDSFKLAGVSGKTHTGSSSSGGQVPIPTTALLIALALPLLRRRK